MAVRIQTIPGGDNGIVKRITLSAAGDSVKYKLRGVVDFLNRGIVFHVRPNIADSTRLAVNFSVDPQGSGLQAHDGSPYTEHDVIHQITPFQSVQLVANGGSAEVDVLLPFRQEVDLIELP